MCLRTRSWSGFLSSGVSTPRSSCRGFRLAERRTDPGSIPFDRGQRCSSGVLPPRFGSRKASRTRSGGRQLFGVQGYRDLRDRDVAFEGLAGYRIAMMEVDASEEEYWSKIEATRDGDGTRVSSRRQRLGRYREWPVFSRPLVAEFWCPPTLSQRIGRMSLDHCRRLGRGIPAWAQRA